MIWFFWVSVAFISFALIAILIVVSEMKRDDILVIDDSIDRIRIKKFLSLHESAKANIELEIDNGLHDREHR